jgi:hypothetical protein
MIQGLKVPMMNLLKLYEEEQRHPKNERTCHIYLWRGEEIE